MLRWTTVVRRFDGSGDYQQLWDVYKSGFGNVSGEYWIGNEYLHYLTSNRSYTVRFDLMDWDNETAYAEYSSFYVESEADKYRLLIGEYSGNASADETEDAQHGFLYHNNTQFTTDDQDNDNLASSNCVHLHGYGGFWYKGCVRAGATNDYCARSVVQNSCALNKLRWDAWHGAHYSLQKLAMMMRPVE